MFVCRRYRVNDAKPAPCPMRTPDQGGGGFSCTDPPCTAAPVASGQPPPIVMRPLHCTCTRIVGAGLPAWAARPPPIAYVSCRRYRVDGGKPAPRRLRARPVTGWAGFSCADAAPLVSPLRAANHRPSSCGETRPYIARPFVGVGLPPLVARPPMTLYVSCRRYRVDNGRGGFP